MLFHCDSVCLFCLVPSPQGSTVLGLWCRLWFGVIVVQRAKGGLGLLAAKLFLSCGCFGVCWYVYSSVRCQEHERSLCKQPHDGFNLLLQTSLYLFCKTQTKRRDFHKVLLDPGTLILVSPCLKLSCWVCITLSSIHKVVQTLAGYILFSLYKSTDYHLREN